MLEFPVGQVQHARTVGAPKPAKSLASLVSRSGDTLGVDAGRLLGLVIACSNELSVKMRSPQKMVPSPALTTFPIILRCDLWLSA
jgi:hypothetical protein